MTVSITSSLCCGRPRQSPYRGTGVASFDRMDLSAWLVLISQGSRVAMHKATRLQNTDLEMRQASEALDLKSRSVSGLSVMLTTFFGNACAWRVWQPF